MLFAVTPFDQITVPEQSIEVKTKFVPAHTTLSASLDIIVGAVGIEFAVIVCVADTKLTQELTVQVAL